MVLLGLLAYTSYLCVQLFRSGSQTKSDSPFAVLEALTGRSRNWAVLGGTVIFAVPIVNLAPIAQEAALTVVAAFMCAEVAVVSGLVNVPAARIASR